ncbi:MAG: hypothetical protein JSS81_24090 [Acidobacteria bacterium]|nr:hypothetical protein [Acidobacteriota bacterium]
MSSSVKMRLLCLTALLFGGVFGAARAELLPVKNYSTSDGLLRDWAGCIRQDSRGFLWFCTSDGLSRFDGYGFKNYTTDDGLPHRNVTDFLETRDGRFWAATRDGLALFDPQGTDQNSAGGRAGGLFTVFRPTDNPQAVDILKLFEDSRGGLWCGTADGFYRIETDGAGISFRRIELPAEKTDGVLPVTAVTEDPYGNLLVGVDLNQGINRISPDGRIEHFPAERTKGQAESVKTMLTTADGRIWVGLSVNGGLCQLDEASAPQQPILTHCLTRQDGLPSNWIHSLYQTADGRIMIGTTKGTAILETASGKLREYREAEGFCDKGTDGFLEDRDGNLWIATNCSVKKIARSGFVRFDAADGLADENVNGFYVAPDGEFYVVTIQTGETADKNDITFRQINRFENERFTFIKPSLPPKVGSGWGSGQIVALAKNRDWWIGGDNRAVYRFPEIASFERPGQTPPEIIAIPDSEVFRIFEDRSGRVWIATMYDGHLLSWDPAAHQLTDHKNELSPDKVARHINSFVDDGAGTLWMGVEYTDEIVRYRNGRFSPLRVDAEKKIGRVNSVFLDSRQRLWIATLTGGVGRIDNPYAEQLKTIWYDRRSGLATDGTHGLAEDGFGRIYVGHGRGIDRIAPETGQIRHFTVADGLPPGLNDHLARDRDGNLWFGGAQGLARLVPESDKPRRAPNILLTGLRIEGVRQTVSELGEIALPELQLNANQTQVSIDFLGLGASLGEELKYQYRLEGAGSEWIETTQRAVDFANLAPGSYNFEVRAVTFDGLTSPQPAHVYFTIAAPVWQRGWVLLLAAAFIAILIYLLYRYRVAELLRVERVRTRIATDLHDDIGANLSKISILSEVARLKMPNGNEENNQLLTSIAEIARESVGSMSDIVWTINPKRDSVLEMTRKMREYAEETFVPYNVAVKFVAPADGENAKLPMNRRRELYLIFKEAVNNAAKHSGCRHVEIEFRCQGTETYLRIGDDGRGFDPDAENTGNGLENMQSRAADLGGKLEIETKEGRGTVISLKIG